MKAAPRLAMVSTGLRRDLLAPIRHFTRLQVLHFYRRASYGDLSSEELAGESLVQYGSPFSLFFLLRRCRPDILQGVEPFSIRLLPYLYAVYLAAALMKTPLVIVTLENRPLEVKHGPLLSRLLRLALRPVFNRAKIIIPLNQGAQRNVLSTGPYQAKLRRVMYGTWGTDLDEYTPVRDGREPRFEAGPILLFVGRLHPEKGIFDLLEAYSRVKPCLPQARLYLVGDGPARDEIRRRVADRGWQESVVLTGTIKNRDLPPYFRAADLLISPSITTPRWEEQVGMTNIHAMASGLPVVSTRSGAIPEYVPDGLAGVLVEEGDPEALAQAVLDLLEDQPLRQQMGRAGRDYAVAHYDARKNVQRAEQILLECVQA